MSKLLKRDKIIILLLLGVLLIVIVIPTSKSSQNSNAKSQLNELETKLTETLSKSTLAGKCKVIITMKNDKEGSLDVVNDDSVLAAKIMGVLVLCENADDMNVVAKITDTVSALLGVPVNRIKVLKMEV